VGDLDAEVARLTALGEKVSEPRLVHRDGDTELWMAWLADPDDHRVAMMQERSA